MSGAISLSGSDSLIIQNHPIVDLAEGSVIEAKFPNNIANLKTGKNQNSIFGFNASGQQCEITTRLIRGSADDKFLNALLAQQNANFAGFVLLIGQYIKKIGDGLGNITSDTYILTAGIFTKVPEAKTNVEGEAEQSVSVYTMLFASAPRVLT